MSCLTICRIRCRQMLKELSFTFGNGSLNSKPHPRNPDNPSPNNLMNRNPSAGLRHLNPLGALLLILV